LDGNGSLDNVEWLRPSPRLASMRRVEVAVVAVCVALIAGGALLASGLWLWAAVVVVVALAGGAVTAMLVERRVRTWGYAERADDLLVQHGLLVARLSVVPYGRMQFIDVTAGPVERAYGLVTVKLHTAAAATDARIPGLTEETGRGLRDRLASLGEANASGL
jgi:uncharacterized protein